MVFGSFRQVSGEAASGACCRAWTLGALFLGLILAPGAWCGEPSAVYPEAAPRAEHVFGGPARPTCLRCHPAAASRIRPSAGVALKFSHLSHGLAQRSCTGCHPAGARPAFPSCQPCHAADLRPDRCAVCHPAGADGRLTLTAASGPLQPRGAHGGPDHGPGWQKSHGRSASADERLCSSCHASSHCDACHRGVQRTWRQHPGDWQLLHATIARGGSGDCQACHRSQSDCLDCHRRTGVSPTGEARPANFGLHPPGFEAGAQHGPEARRNLTACSACHREGDCIRCHGAVGLGQGVNPHPPDFRRRCRLWFGRNPRPCLKCHRSEDLLECQP